MGALSSQADVAREAYEVLRDQAVERREGLSGVNLDEEASSLIRFQQSYQAQLGSLELLTSYLTPY